jgi:hypothetical protein
LCITIAELGQGRSVLLATVGVLLLRITTVTAALLASTLLAAALARVLAASSFAVGRLAPGPVHPFRRIALDPIGE